MGHTLTLNRMGQTGKALSIGFMGAETALVFLGCLQAVHSARFARLDRGFSPLCEISYRGAKPPRVSAGLEPLRAAARSRFAAGVLACFRRAHLEQWRRA